MTQGIFTMAHTRTLALSALMALGATTFASAQQVNITLKDGRVTLRSENASARQILEEWARVGQAKVVNAEKVTGPPMTLTLIDVPEREALETVLRSAAGYAVQERTVASTAPNASVFDRILVMGRTTPVTQTASAATAAPAVAYVPPANNDTMTIDETVADEPPQPTAPVVNPYANANGALSGANPGANGSNIYSAPGYNGGGTSSAFGTSNTANSAQGGAIDNRPAETKFDYANPQAYFERQRQQQQQTGQAPQSFNPYPGSGYVPPVQPQAQPTQPTNTPGAGTTLSQPGISPVPQQNTTPPAGSGAGFNPYNMNPYNMPNNPQSSAPPTSVEPDRAKYANPYVPSTTRPNQD
jgi:hypothetical protein